MFQKLQKNPTVEADKIPHALVLPTSENVIRVCMEYIYSLKTALHTLPLEELLNLLGLSIECEIPHLVARIIQYLIINYNEDQVILQQKHQE